MQPPTKLIILGVFVSYVVNECMFVGYIHIDAETGANSCTITSCKEEKMISSLI